MSVLGPKLIVADCPAFYVCSVLKWRVVCVRTCRVDVMLTGLHVELCVVCCWRESCSVFVQNGLVCSRFLGIHIFTLFCQQLMLLLKPLRRPPRKEVVLLLQSPLLMCSKNHVLKEPQIKIVPKRLLLDVRAPVGMFEHS